MQGGSGGPLALALAQCVVDPGIKYLESHFGPIAPKAGAVAGEMSHLVSFFKCARIVDPFSALSLLHVLMLTTRTCAPARGA